VETYSSPPALFSYPDAHLVVIGPVGSDAATSKEDVVVGGRIVAQIVVAICVS
jgi:hypothetical protein